MQKIYILFFLLLSGITVDRCFSQVLYENNTLTGISYNPGLGEGEKPIIVFDDIEIPVSRILGVDSIGITLVKVGIGRASSASAVTVKIFITSIDPAAIVFNSLPAVPPVFLTSFDLPAGGSSTLLSVGDSINPFFKFKADTSSIFPGFQTLFVGVSFSTSEISNGWIFSNKPDASADIIFEYDSLNMTRPRYSFNFQGNENPPQASFYAQVYGKIILPAVVPVMLKDFSVAKNNRQNLVTWKTETEINTSVFNVERSKDGSAFENIGQVAASGNSNSFLTYQFFDNTPNKGINYYRLRMVDKNNNITFSTIRNVRNDAVSALAIYPNPAISSIKADINSEIAGNGVIIMTDINGRQVYYRRFHLIAGNNTIEMDIKKLPPGSYALKMNLNDKVIVKKITKQ